MCHPVLPPVISLSRSHFLWYGGTSFRNAEEIGSIQSAKLGEDNAFRAPPLHLSPSFSVPALCYDARRRAGDNSVARQTVFFGVPISYLHVTPKTLILTIA